MSSLEAKQDVFTRFRTQFLRSSQAFESPNFAGKCSRLAEDCASYITDCCIEESGKSNSNVQEHSLWSLRDRFRGLRKESKSFPGITEDARKDFTGSLSKFRLSGLALHRASLASKISQTCELLTTEEDNFRKLGCQYSETEPVIECVMERYKDANILTEAKSLVTTCTELLRPEHSIRSESHGLTASEIRDKLEDLREEAKSTFDQLRDDLSAIADDEHRCSMVAGSMVNSLHKQQTGVESLSKLVGELLTARHIRK